MAEVLEIEEPQQIPQPEDPPRKKLYKGLVKKGLYTKSYEDFEGQFRTPESIDKLYKGMYDKGLYTKTREDFNSQFFSDNLKKKVGRIGLEESSLQAGNSLSTGVGSDEIPKIEMYTTPSGEMVETDPISLSKKYNELKNKTILHRTGGEGTASQFLPDENARKEADKLQEDFKDFDLGGIYEETKDLNDEILAGHGKRLMQERKENPQLYQRDMANLKWRSGFEKQLLNEVDKGNIDLDNYNRIKHSIDTLPEFTGQGDYSNQRLAIQSLSKDIQLYGGENKDKLLKDFAVEVSKVYGNAYNNKFSEAVKGTPESKYFNEDAQLAYNYLQDVATDKAEQYKRLLIDPKTLKDKSDEQKGYNHLMQTLEETGIGLQQNSVSEELNNLKAIAERNNGLTPEQIQKATDLEKKQDELNQKRDELDKKYPDRITNKVADAVNEIMGHDLNWGEYAMVKTGQAFKNTGEGIWEMVSSPFMSDASNNLRELAIMGENITSETNLKQPDKNKSLLYDKFIIEPDLQKQADEIKSDKGLNDEQKRSKLFSLFYNNRDKFGRVPIQNGKFNINPSSILYGVTDLATGLLPFVGIEMATGGIGGAGAAAKFIRTFTAAAATTFHDEYAGALMEGKTQTDAYKSAMASTAINSMAMAGAATPTAIKEMASGMKTSASKIIAQMSEAEIQKVLAKGTPKGLKAFGQSLKERGKAIPSMVWQGLKTGAKFEAYMAGANILNDREVNFKQALINTANFGILGAGLGQIGFKSPTELQKSHGLEFGKNPDEYIEVAKEMKKNGQLNESELNHRIDLIERYGEAYKTLPKSNDNGKPLNEKQKSEYLYNSVIKNEGNKAASTLPPKQAEKAAHTALVSDFKNGIILEEPTDKQLESRQSRLEKILEPKKDEKGEVIELPEKIKKEAEAELDAVKEVIEENNSAKIAHENAKKLLSKTQETKDNIIPDEKNENLTKEAQDLLASIGEGSKPTFITKNLERIAKENGIEVTDKMSADDVINALKEKQSQPTPQTGKGEGEGDWSKDVESTAKAIEKNPSVINKIIGDEYYHGTSLPKSEPDFTTANKDKGVGVRSNAFMGTSREQKSPFFFITSERDVANDFAQAKKEYHDDKVKPNEKHTSRIIPFKFNEKNSKILDLTKDDYEFVLQEIGESPIDFFGMGMYEQDQMWEMLDEPKFAEKLKSLGYDAVKFIEPKRGIGIAVLNTDKIVNSTPKGIAEAYQKAKDDGSNPELVKAVEDLLGKAPTQYTEAAAPKEQAPKPIVNEEPKASEVVNPETEGSITETKPDKSVQKTGKYEEKARKIADKIKEAELPSWLKIDDATIKKSGVSADEIKKALADATIKMGQLLDKGVEFADAVKEAVKGLVDLLGEDKREVIEKGFRDDYNKGLGEFGKSGVKKEVTNEVRVENNMPKVDFPKMNSDYDALNEAKQRVDDGEVNPQEMVNRILTEKGNYKNEAEVMDMQYYAHQLSKKNNELLTELSQAKTPEEKLEVSGRLLQLSDLIDAQTEAAQIAGNQWGKTGNRMQPVINDAGQIFRDNKATIKEAYGGEVPKEVQDRLDAITRERDEALAAKAKLEEELKQKMAAKGFEEMKKRAAKSSKTKETAEQLKKEEQELLKELKDAGKADPNAPKRSGIGLTDKHIIVIGKLAVNYFKQGINGLEAIIDKIHDAVRDEISGITRKDIRDLLANYDPLTMEREIDRLNKKADILDNKLTPPSVDSKGKPTEKTDFAKPSKVERTFRNNTEWVKANQRVANAEFKMKIEKRKAFESKKNYFQRGLMWLGRIARLSVLSGTNVLYKLASAATIGSAVKRIPEQAIGAIYSQVFKGIAKKAPIEGFLNAKSEAKFYKEFFNPVKFGKNAWEILKTGSSPLSRRLGSAEYEHVPILYLPTDTHQIIKDPPKRATFEASFRNGLIWAEKNGLDINDQLVINSLENAAYKRAQYEIFQEQNWLSKKFTSYKSALEKKGNIGAVGKFLVDFMIPVSTVPTNIARRLTTTSPAGLIRGSAEVVNAYRKGIEKLTPDQADHVMQQLKQGTLGTALWLIGWYGYQYFGGLYSRYNPNSKREEGDMLSDVMIIGGKEIPKPTQHALPLETIQMAATARRVYENYRNNKNAETPKALLMAGMASIGVLAEEIPIIETPTNTILAAHDPEEAEKLQEDIDRRIVPQFVRERMDKTKGLEELKYLHDKGLKIVKIHKEDIHPIDKNGNKVFVTEDKFKEIERKREEKIIKQLSEAKKKGFIDWETGKVIPADKVTSKQLKSWLMGASTKAKNEAITEVFGEQPEKPPISNLEINQ